MSTKDYMEKDLPNDNIDSYYIARIIELEHDCEYWKFMFKELQKKLELDKDPKRRCF